MVFFFVGVLLSFHYERLGYFTSLFFFDMLTVDIEKRRLVKSSAEFAGARFACRAEIAFIPLPVAWRWFMSRGQRKGQIRVGQTSERATI